MVDVLGSMAFNPVKSDMLGNVKVPRHSIYLEDIYCRSNKRADI
jgi:hypothetical protein